MRSPWLDIPLEDYEGHMDSPEVRQLQILSELFAEALAQCRPESVAILGIAGGNGLRHIDRTITTRVVGLDVNPSYLEEVRSRYADDCGPELFCVDLADQRVDLGPAHMVHAALVLEHAGAGRCLDNAVSLVAAGGTLSVVLQLPGETGQDVGVSPFPSMQTLQPGFALIDPEWLRRTLEQRGFRLAREARRALPAGKAFWMGMFRR